MVDVRNIGAHLRDIPDEDILRLANRGQRPERRFKLERCLYGWIRATLKAFLAEVICKAIRNTERNRRHTISVEDLRCALKSLGVTVYTFSNKLALEND